MNGRNRRSVLGYGAVAWDNKTSPRRRANAVTPGALTDQTLEGVIG